MEEQNSIGYHKWLIDAIRENCAGGEELITASKPLGKSKQYKWLLAQLSERGEVEIVEEFHNRRRAEVNERAWRQKRRRLTQIEANLASRRANRQEVGLTKDDSYSLQLEKDAAKLRRSIEKHDEQEGETNARAEL